MSGLAVLCGVVAGLGWSLMVGVGVLHGAGAVNWTLSYDEAVALVAVIVVPWATVVGASVLALRDTKKGSGH